MSYVEGYTDETYLFKVCKSDEKHQQNMQNGYNHLLRNNSNDIILYTYDGYIRMPQTANFIIENFSEDDVLTIYKGGRLTCEYNSCSNDNALVATLKCNSNCLMCPCSERSRKNSKLFSFNELKEKLRYFPRDMQFLTITGGEPTLLNSDFLSIMKVLQHNFSKTQFQLLTNGRTFADYSFTKKFIDVLPDNIYLGIPLYGYNEETHDLITQAPGSFKQAVIGIHNLLHFNLDVEIRIVLSKLNIEYITEIAIYIIKYFPGVHSVKLMGLEMLGNAMKNKDIVWLPYQDIASRSEKAINLLINNGIDVKLFNFPLCTVKRIYWPICSKSISDYKVTYFEDCENCEVKTICGGVFNSTGKKMKFKPIPIGRKS